MAKYTSILSLVKHLQLFRSIPNKDHQSVETVGTGDSSNAIFWLNKLGVITASYIISSGSVITARTSLTDITHYSLDLDTSKITLTTDGITSVGTAGVYGEYDYNSENILHSDLIKAIDSAENKIESVTEQRFADATAADPGYRKILNETLKGHYSPEDKVYDLFFNPLVKLQTTVNGAYTTGGTTITLTDGGGFPNAATIYIGGNKVVYTARSSNDITVPSSTSSIADAAKVRGEVVELNIEPEGNAPSYTVLDPDTGYEIDYLNGRIKILRNAFFGEISAEDRIYPSNYLVRVSYHQAWHEEGGDPFIPIEIEEVANMIAAKKFLYRMIAKAHTQGMNKFNPEVIKTSDDEINRILNHYKTLNVGTSMYNKQSLT